jgi:putative endonuclease
MTERSDTGKLGEELARNYLKKKGYRIVETNYRTRFGEIDIVATHKKVLVFIEVRTKNSTTYGTPEESITAKKASHLRAAAYLYLRAHQNLPEMWRIDFVAVEIDDKGKAKRIEIYESAVGEG